MATLKELEDALIRADQAGNIEDAKILADEIRKRRSAPEPTEEAFDFSARQMVRNIPQSAVQLGQDIATPVISPIETTRAVSGLAGGVARKLTPESLRRPLEGGVSIEDLPPEHRQMAEKFAEAYKDIDFSDRAKASEQIAEATGQYYKDRYGSFENLQKTIQDDPVGFLADVSGLLTFGGAAATKAAGTAGKAGKTAAKVAQKVEQVGRATDPFNIALSPITKAVPRTLMEKATKFRTTLDDVRREAMIDTMIARRIKPTRKGLRQAQKLRKELGGELNRLLKEAGDKGVTIHKSEIYDALQKTLDDMTGMRWDAPDNQRVILSEIEKYDAYINSLGKESLTPKELQFMKRGAQSRVDWNKARKGEALDMPKEAVFRDIAGFAKQRLEDIDPRIGPINRQLEPLMDLKTELPKVTHRIQHRDPIGIMTPIMIGGGGAAGGTPGAAAGAIAATAQRPLVMANAAILADLLRQSRGSTPLVLSRQALIQSGRLPQNEEIARLLRDLY